MTDPDGFDIYDHLGVARDDDPEPDWRDSTPGDDERPEAEPRSGWFTTALGDVMRQMLAGARPRPRPEVLWPDGAEFGLFYPARVNLIFGPSTSGKTWTALIAIVEMLRAGCRVAFIDIEDNADLLADRLIYLGVDPEVVDARMAYYEQPYGKLTVEMAHQIGGANELVVVDAIGGLMSLAGLDPDKNADVHRIRRHVFALAEAGACVILLDHTGKYDNGSLDSIGAGAKRQILTGASYRAVGRAPFHRDGGGVLDLVLAKDRPGGLPYSRGQATAVLRQHRHGDEWSLTLVDGLGVEFDQGGK